MAKATILILCPSGHRRKAQMTPNSNLLQVLEDMCNQERLDSLEWGLIHQRKKCDLTIPWRLLSVPTNALLEMYKLDERRAMSNVTVQLQLPDNSRHTGSFEPTMTLQQMLEWYRRQPGSAIATLDSSNSDQGKLFPVCAYMSDEIIGEHALSNMTLRDLGLTSGSAVIRYTLRAISDDDLKKINDRVDEKLNRRRQQSAVAAAAAAAKPESEPFPAPPVAFNPPPAPRPVPVVESSTFPTTTTSLFNSQPHSIFDDHHASLPAKQQKPKTLAETLGIRISLDAAPSMQPDFSDFKFPETTKGQNLFQTDSTKDSDRSHDLEPCDRHTMAYDLTKVPSSREKQSEELPDSFFELTPDDLRSILHTLRQQGAEDSPLETNTMRNRTQSTRNVRYEHIAIRFVVSSTYVLQGLFYPNETVSNLLEFVRTHLVCPQLQQADFYLYTSPPRVVLSNLTKPLLAYDLAPAAYVYLGHRTVSPLSIQLGSNVRVGTIDEANQLVTQHVFRQTRAMSDEEIKRLASAKTTATASASSTTQSAKRNASAVVADDKDLKDRLRKFLPGKK